VLTLVQTRKGRAIPIVCGDRDYWTRTINFDLLLEAQVISPADFHLLRFADDAESAWQEFAAAGIQTANPRPILRASDEGLEMMPSG
jgi:predicted Rossmann-fold nucleotide-binding protein